MTLSTAWLDELRARTVLSAVISPSVKLLRAGREWKACCPFHNEKTPSFTINDDKGFYHCFGCGAHGDAIRFLTDHRGLPFMDAVKELAGKAGMEVPAPDPKMRERAERTASLTDVMASVQAWFREQLQGLGGTEAREYLNRRGFSPAILERFGFGFAPDNRGALCDRGRRQGRCPVVSCEPAESPGSERCSGRRMRSSSGYVLEDARHAVRGHRPVQ